MWNMPVQAAFLNRQLLELQFSVPQWRHSGLAGPVFNAKLIVGHPLCHDDICFWRNVSSEGVQASENDDCITSGAHQDTCCMRLPQQSSPAPLLPRCGNWGLLGPKAPGQPVSGQARTGWLCPAALSSLFHVTVWPLVSPTAGEGPLLAKWREKQHRSKNNAQDRVKGRNKY